MMEIIHEINNFTWGWGLSILLLASGVFVSVRLKAPQFRFFPQLWKNIKTSMFSDGENKISGFGVLCSSLGSLIGTGTLVGTATALMSGGPGAIFWMWVVAFIAMPLSFSETILAQLFREKGPDGSYCGGAAYYISKGLKKKKLGAAYSVCMIGAIGLCYVMVQSNSISQAVRGVADVNPWLIGTCTMILSALVIVGGLKRLTDITTYIVPFMAISYIICSLIIIIVNIQEVPAIFAMIFKSAFSGHAAAGGIAGYSVQQAFRYGVARGMFSNDAGTGCSGGLNAGAEVKHPVEQGFSAMLGVFIVTTIICTSTALCILFTGVMETGYSGIQLTQAAFKSVMGPVGGWIIMIAMFLFAYTSLLAEIYLGEGNINYLSKKNAMRKIWVYRIVAAAVCIIGAVVPLDAVWDLVDFAICFMIIINLYAILRMSNRVKYVLNDWIGQRRKGVKRPEWDYSRDMSTMPGKEEA